MKPPPRLSLFAAAALLVGCFAKAPPPKEAPPAAEGEPAGYLGFRFANRTAWSAAVILEDTLRREVARIDLERPAQEVHVGRILKPQGGLELPPEVPPDPPTVVRLRPGAYRVKGLELRKGKRKEGLEGSGEVVAVEDGTLTYIGSFTLTQGAATRAFSFATAGFAAGELEGIEGRAALKIMVIDLE